MQWENNIKKTLEKRRIEPSAASWDSLANRLDVADKKKNKMPFWWMGIAASLIGVLLITNVFFKDNPADSQKPVIVDVQKPVDKKLLTEPSSVQHLATESETVKNVEMTEKETSINQLIKDKNTLDLATPIQSTIAKTEKTATSEQVELEAENQSFEDKKVSEIVVQINDLRSKGQTVTDADIEALLLKAQKEIAFQNVLKESVQTVDANSLLQDVEDELQQSFRNKIFEALKNSYETVKTAVAERNN